MKKIVFIAGHLGYPMEETPLGGGAMVGLNLVRSWARAKVPFELTVLGSGPLPPETGIKYVRLPEGRPVRDIVKLSEFAYGRFCREFEAATTRWVLDRRKDYPPEETCLLVNDISEGPTLAPLVEAGYPIVSIWHVDVVDYFSKIYLKGLVKPERLTRFYERVRGLGGRWAIPALLSLVFEKQRETVAKSRKMIFPSRTMAATVERCYGQVAPSSFSKGAVVVPWGVLPQESDEGASSRAADRLRDHYQLGPESRVLLTLSRISPEKGLHILIDALRRLEEKGGLPEGDVCLFLCGEAAFMQGEAYLRRVRKAAQGLKKVRVFFPGYLSAAEKRAFLKIAHLFVSPSIHESYGLTVVEAMQAGLPVLASDHYGVRDLLDPSFGRMVHYHSPAEAAAPLASAIGEMLGDKENLSRMGAAARRSAEGMPFEKAAQRVLQTALDLVTEDKR